MWRGLACALAICASDASASPGYRPFVLGGGEVAILDADTGLKDWRPVEGAPNELLVHDRTGQWYRVRLEQAAGCAFGSTLSVLAYGTDLQHLFGPGMWVRNTSYPYRRCSVRSTRPVATPDDQIGVDYAAEYRPTLRQAVARRLTCEQRMSSFWTRPLASAAKRASLCR